MSDPVLNAAARRRIHELCRRAVSDELSPAEQAELEQLIVADQVARRYYIACLQTELALKTRFGPAGRAFQPSDAKPAASRDEQAFPGLSDHLPGDAPDVDESMESVLPVPRRDRQAAGSGDEPNRPPRRTIRQPAAESTRHSLLTATGDRPVWREHPVLFGTLALVVTFALWTAFYWAFLLGGRDNDLADEYYGEAAVAYFSGSDAAVWDDATKLKYFGRGDSKYEGPYYAGDRLQLRSGVIRLSYATGAVVVLQGPVEYWVGGHGAGSIGQGAGSSELRAPSSNAGYLAVGSLVARCESADSKGFTVTTPHARVRDLGTEFAVDVRRDGAAEVVVLSGEVELVAQSAGGSTGQGLRLKKGQGASVASGGAITPRENVGTKQFAKLRERIDKNFTAPAEVATTSTSASAPTATVAIRQTTSNGSAPWRFERAAGSDNNPRDAGQTFLVDAATYPAGLVLDKITIRIAALSGAGYDGAGFTLAVYEFSNTSDVDPGSPIHTARLRLPGSLKRQFDGSADYLTMDLTDQTLTAGRQYGFLLMLDAPSAPGDNLLIAIQTDEDAYANGIAIRRHNRGTGGDTFAAQQFFSGSLDSNNDMEFYLHGSAAAGTK